ncbi:glycosyltransferase [Puia sp. P3]|uniref:glycosyltransferase n=1 Tax=Puia sp. P3 TaxID=3423952 RepID=UPI003D67E3E1
MGPLYILTFLSCLLLIVYGLLIVWYFRAWASIPPVAQPAAWRTWRTWITVVVPARNEEENILRCLDSLAAQSYPKHLYEVIVVDDHSTDGTVELVEAFGGRAGDLTIRCIRLSEQEGARTAHKKWAIESGIRLARGQLDRRHGRRLHGGARLAGGYSGLL